CLVLRRLCGDRRRCLAAAATRSGTASCGRGRKDPALGGVHREPDDASLWHVRLPRERRIGGVGRRNPEVPIHVEPDGHQRAVLCEGDSDRTQRKNAGDEHPGKEFAHARRIICPMKLRSLTLALVCALGASAAAQQPPAPGRGRGPQPVDPRVEIRMHHFAETNEDIPYALFVSSKVRKNKKAPMIVTLHGIGGTHTTMMRPNAIDLAEAGGYILLSPMGYNPRGWYGAPAPRGRRGAPPPAPNAAPNDAAIPAPPNAAAAPPQGRRGALPPGLLNNPDDPPNLRELSEKETLE